MTEHMNGYTCEDVEDVLLDAQRDIAALQARLADAQKIDETSREIIRFERERRVALERQLQALATERDEGSE